MQNELKAFTRRKHHPMAFQDKVQAQSPRLTPQASRSVSFVELRQSLPSQVAIISPCVDQLMGFIARFRTGGESELDIEIALREALANAIVHGNQEILRKRVYVTCRCATDGEVSITVEDEGQGFDCEAIPDPTAPENRLLTYGRGIHFMKALMDEVCFERGGAVVHMRKNPIQRHAGEGLKESQRSAVRSDASGGRKRNC
jgi:serine/threonine-protein kinase RsbW